MPNYIKPLRIGGVLSFLANMTHERSLLVGKKPRDNREPVVYFRDTKYKEYFMDPNKNNEKRQPDESQPQFQANALLHNF